LKFDAYTCSVFVDPELFLGSLVHHFDAEISKASPSNGYDEAVQINVPRFNPIRVQWGVRYDGVYCSTMGVTAPRLVEFLRREFPDHSVSRVDACEDYTAPHSWDYLVSQALAVADQAGVKVHHEGDWFRGERGRTLYFGSKSSVYQICLYEKGKQLGGDPNWVRLEFRLRPQSRDKARVSTATPYQVASAARWGATLMERLSPLAPDRTMAPTYPPEGDLSRRRSNLIRQYHRVILDLFEDSQFNPSAVGYKLVQLAIDHAYRGEDRAAALNALDVGSGVHQNEDSENVEI